MKAVRLLPFIKQAVTCFLYLIIIFNHLFFHGQIGIKHSKIEFFWHYAIKIYRSYELNL